MTTKSNKNIKETQWKTGKEIVSHFKENNRYVILYGMLQAGKTGTYHAAALYTLRNKLIKKVFILCGMSDNDLKNQCIADYNSYLHYYNQLTNNNEIEISIHFLNDFDKLMSDKSLFKDSLIIIDESDRDQSKGGKMDLLLTYHNMQLDGNSPIINDNNTYILSVSATPFSEISSLEHGLSYNKQIVTLGTGAGYRGIKEFYNKKLIHPISKKFKQNKEYFVKIVKDKGLMYNLVRIVNSRSEEFSIIKELCEIHNFDLIIYNESCQEPINEIIKEKPIKPTIILVQGRLRAGKVLKYKQHIGFVWENTKNPNTDTILQGLPGRCCGYHDFDIDIYIPSALLTKKVNMIQEMNEIERYIESYNMINDNTILNQYTNEHISIETRKQISILPRNGTNLISNKEFKCVKSRKDNKYATIAIRLNKFYKKDDTITDNSIVDILNYIKTNDMISQYIHKDQVKDVTDIINSLLNNNKFYKYTIRHYKDNQYNSDNNKGCGLSSFYQSFIEKNPYVGSQGNMSSDLKDVTIAIVHHNYNQEYKGESDYGDVYIVFRTRTAPFKNMYNAPIDIRISSTSGKEIYRRIINSESPIILSTFKYPITNSLKTLKLQIDETISLWNDSRKKYTSISILPSVEFNETPILIKEYFGNKKNNLDSVIKELQIKYNVVLNIEYSNNIESDIYKYLKNISWKLK